jgi:polyisoprenoid-binding protein YceI
MSQSAPTRTIEGIDLPPAGTWTLDPAHTSVEFVARHMLTKIRGRFSGFEGAIVVGEDPLDSSVEVSVQTATIGSNQEMRDNHLKSADFLDVERFPAMTFTSRKVRHTGGNELEIVGDLTIKDITREIVLTAEFLGWGPHPQGGSVMSFSARADINREDWDMTWNLVLETGSLLVSKKVSLEIEVEAILREDE